MIHDAEAAAGRLVAFLRSGEMPCLDGGSVRLAAESVCVHGDTPGAVAMARVVRARLEAEGLRWGPSLAEPVFRAVSDCGVLVEFGTVLSDAVHGAVLALDAALAADPVAGQIEVVPAYVNVMVVFDPLVTSHGAVMEGVRARLGRGRRCAGPCA